MMTGLNGYEILMQIQETQLSQLRNEIQNLTALRDQAIDLRKLNYEVMAKQNAEIVRLKKENNGTRLLLDAADKRVERIANERDAERERRIFWEQRARRFEGETTTYVPATYFQQINPQLTVGERLAILEAGMCRLIAEAKL